jgi:putative phosphoribosyl transferase
MADVQAPHGPSGAVVFVHGSGSSRFSPRNREVAKALNEAGLATVLFDLLTPAEARDRSLVFDVELLAGRLVSVLRWLRARPGIGELPIGLFGASTGAAAALAASTDPGVEVSAIVSRGGRPDLAPWALADVTAPTLLIVGGDDAYVLELNRQAAARLHCPHEVLVIPGATHLFEEPGALEAVSAAAGDWFGRHLRGTVRPSA